MFTAEIAVQEDLVKLSVNVVILIYYYLFHIYSPQWIVYDEHIMF